MNTRSHWHRWLTAISLFITLLFLSALLIPEQADAKRMGGGSSMGSRGSQSFSAPKQAPAQRSAPDQATAPSSSPSSPTSRPGMFGGLMGGIGGFLLGGMLGALLFGNMDGGMGFLDILLFGGIAYMLYKMYKSRTAPQPQPATGLRKEMYMPEAAPTMAGGSFSPSPGVDEVTRGIRQISTMDPSFREDQFLDGAKRAFSFLQEAWSNWQVNNLRPYVTERMMAMLEAQDKERQQHNRRDITSQIQFRVVEVSEAWQESGQDWITVHFVVQMLEYATNLQGQVVEGSDTVPVTVEEYWTFCREVGNRDPNWLLSAIQQPGQVASATL